MAPTKGTVEISRNNARKIIEALPIMLSSGSVVFDIETTGINKNWEEIVSIAVKSPDGQVEMQTLIMPKRPKRLLQKGENGKCAYDINGIHPDDLIGSPTFEEAYPQIREALEGKHWVCWNAEFDVEFLDEICARRNADSIPRAGVLCAMKLLSPLAGLRGQRRGQIERVLVKDGADDKVRWQQLSRLARRMGIDTRQAHDAAADVTMTIEAIKWASENLKSLPAPRQKAAAASRKVKPAMYQEKEIEDFEKKISTRERQQIMNEKIIMCQADGKSLESVEDFQAVLVTQNKTNHVLHLVISIFTGGLWLPVWLLIALTKKNRREILQVDESGMASLKPAKS